MRMKNLCLSVCCCVFVSIVYSQTLTIDGRLLDKDRKPVVFANVELLNAADSAKLGTALSSESGVFSFKNIKPGKYVLAISALSFVKTYIAVSGEHIGDVLLVERPKDLQQVMIVSKRPLVEQKLDRMIVNVQDNLIFSGGTALEVLNRSPGVAITSEMGLITLNGKNDVAIMINGKTSRMPLDALILMLSGMPAQNIQKIELITNPGAKYDATAAGGIINIVMITERGMGWNGSVSVTGGYGGKERLGLASSLAYKNKSLNFYGDLSYYRNNNKQLYQINKLIYDQDKTTKDSLLSHRTPLSNFYSGKIGIDYNIDSNTVIGGFVAGLADQFILHANTDAKDVDTNLNLSYLRIGNYEDNQWDNLTGNLYVNHKMGRRQSLNADLTYLYYYNSNGLYYQNNYYDEHMQYTYTNTMKASNKAPINSWVGKLDYSNQLSGTQTLEFGVKGSLSHYRSNIEVDTLKDGAYVPDNTLTQIFRLTERVGAVYGNLDTKIGKKLELITGLRYEHFYLNTVSLAGELTRHAGDLFPSVNIAYQADDKNVFQASYNRRVSRPAYNDFAPYITFIDPRTSFTGNQRLTQSIADGYKLDYKYNEKYIVSFQYTHIGNGIIRFQPQADVKTNSLYYASVNLRYVDEYALTLSIPVTINSWWNMQNNVLAHRQLTRTQHLADNVTLSNNHIELNSTWTLKLSQVLSAELSGFYHSPQLYGFSHVRAVGNMDAGMEAKLTQKSKLRIAINNILGKYKDWDLITNKEFLFNLYARYEYAPLVVKATYTLNFGGEKSDKGRERASGSEDIEGRIR